MQTEEPLRFEPWMRGVLLLAGIYNLAWGFFIKNFPNSFYQWVTETENPAIPAIEWQGLGVLFFGVFYTLTALYPKKLWYLIIAGILSKLLGGIWFYFVVMEQTVTNKFLFHLIMNDLVWVVPFTIIAVRAWKVYHSRA